MRRWKCGFRPTCHAVCYSIAWKLACRVFSNRACLSFEEHARRVLRPGIVRDADPGLREHDLYAYYYDRVDQPAVAHEDG